MTQNQDTNHLDIEIMQTISEAGVCSMTLYTVGRVMTEMGQF